MDHKRINGQHGFFLSKKCILFQNFIPGVICVCFETSCSHATRHTFFSRWAMTLIFRSSNAMRMQCVRCVFICAYAMRVRVQCVFCVCSFPNAHVYRRHCAFWSCSSLHVIYISHNIYWFSSRWCCRPRVVVVVVSALMFSHSQTHARRHPSTQIASTPTSSSS